MKRIYVSTLVSAAAGIAAVGLIAGCSSSSGTSTTADATSTAGAGSGYSAYTACLTQHGVTLPSRGAFGAGRRTHAAGSFTPGARPSGGAGGFGGFGGASANPTMAAAIQACASDRPTGGAGGFGGGGSGGGFGGGSSRLTAFRSCMTQQGEALPTTRPTAVSTATGSARYLNGLNPSDPKVAAALKVCDPLIPTASPKATASSAS
jgi:hypothetical protein